MGTEHIQVGERKTTALRRLFERPETTLIPFGAFPVHAQMAEHAGFEAFELSGGMSAFWVEGVPDAGLLTQTEVVQHARRVARSVDIPVYSDADTGFGSAQNTWRTTQEFIHAGVAGIHLEDQSEPKRAGGSSGVRLVSDAEAVGRIQAAVAAKRELDPDFVIVARTDAYGAEGGGLEEAIRRGNLYLEEGGADYIFYEGIPTWDEARTAIHRTAGTAYAIVSKSAGPSPSVAEMTEMRQAISVLRFAVPTVQEAWNLLLDTRDAGSLKPIDDYIASLEQYRGTERWTGHGDVFVKPSMEEIRQREAAFLPPEHQREYTGDY